jgi:Na+-transporting NADH:ubiquinone oxidoreductase subunit NqrB
MSECQYQPVPLLWQYNTFNPANTPPALECCCAPMALAQPWACADGLGPSREARTCWMRKVNAALPQCMHTKNIVKGCHTALD